MHPRSAFQSKPLITFKKIFFGLFQETSKILNLFFLNILCMLHQDTSDIYLSLDSKIEIVNLFRRRFAL